MKKQSAKINYPKSTKNKKVLITMLIDAENEPMLIETIEKIRYEYYKNGFGEPIQITAWNTELTEKEIQILIEP